MEYNMRNINRIDAICKQLAQLWKELPDWRLSQLMSNILVSKDCFYMEDDEFIEYIKKYIEKLKEELSPSQKEGRCPLFSICDGKTAVCAVRLPDEDCWYYRYFKKLIKEDEK